MRYAYAITGALLLSGTAATMIFQPPVTAQTAQNEPGTMAAVAPKAGAPLSFADLVARLQPAVVNISTKQTITVQPQANPFQGTPLGDLFGQFQGDQGGGGGAPIKREGASLGSGFIISPDGYVVTNNHVVAAGAKGATVDSITVIMPDRKEYTAKLIGRDPSSDLALLKINGTNLPYVKFGDSTRARVGDWVVAIGNPFGIGSTVTAGIVSALHRVTGAGAYDRFIQTDASINRGNSGGPMFNLNGDVIGINSQILSETGGSVGIGFAIPAEDAKPVIDQLMKGAAIKRGYLGVGPQPISDDIASALGLPKNQGEILRSIEPGEPAAKAGLQVGDVVTRVGGKDVTPDSSLSYLVANIAPGTRTQIDVIRQGKPVSVAAVIGTRPSEEALQAKVAGDDDGGFGTGGDDGQNPGQTVPSANALGLTVVPLTPGIARNIGVDASVSGVVVASTDPSTDAGQKLKRGDVIVSANGARVASAAELSAIVAQAKAAGRDQVLLYVQRQRLPALFVGIKLKK